MKLTVYTNLEMKEVTAMPGETSSQDVDLLKSNETYGVRGEVQVAAINGTTVVCRFLISHIRV